MPDRNVSDSIEPNELEVKKIERIPKLSTVRISIGLSIFLLILVSALTYFAKGPIMQYRETDPVLDGYVQPRSISKLVSLVQDSTVSIYCEYNSEGDYDQGTGWAMNIETDMQDTYPTALITNHHVIENCIGNKGKLTVAAFGGEEYPAVIDNFDAKNDLAVLATKLILNPLELSENIPNPGYWVMAVGTADGFEGSVAFGNVLNITEDEVLITAAISGGNSGGPLVDNEGKVIGTNSWSSTKEQYNGAKSLDAMCSLIMECGGKTYWDWKS
jgi:S1-C subfamily serine protease